MKKLIFLILLLLPINIYAMEETKLSITVDASNIKGYNSNVIIYYIEDTSLVDPPLKQINVTPSNNFQILLTKGKDFKDFNYQSIQSSNNKYYDYDIKTTSENNTLSYIIKIKNEKEFVDYQTNNTTTEVGNASELVIGDVTNKTTVNVKNKKDNQERQKNINNRKLIYKTIFIVILGVFLLISIFIIIKFTQSNK